MTGSTALELALRLATDVGALALLIAMLRRSHDGDDGTRLLLVMLNLGLFVSLTAIHSGSFSTGSGFGLFGLLSLVRLRSTSFSDRTVAFTFVSLVLGLVNGLTERVWWLPVGLSALLLTATAIVGALSSPAERRALRLTLDQVVPDAAEARLAVERVLREPVLSVSIEEIDFVRETSRVTATCAPARGGPTRRARAGFEWLPFAGAPRRPSRWPAGGR